MFEIMEFLFTPLTVHVRAQGHTHLCLATPSYKEHKTKPRPRMVTRCTILSPAHQAYFAPLQFTSTDNSFMDHINLWNSDEKRVNSRINAGFNV